MPATQPALALPTMNAHCMAVRIAMLNTQNPANLSAEVLDELIAKTDAALALLRDVFKAARGDESIRMRCETSGKALERVQYGLRGRRGNA